MNPELKQKWVAALRSGQYQQAHSMMYDEMSGGYCCLGVLCELHSPGVFEDESLVVETNSVQEVLGIDLEVPRELERELACRNDGDDGFDQHTFAEIADLIEAKL